MTKPIIDKKYNSLVINNFNIQKKNTIFTVRKDVSVKK